jgi:hypothetical protein
MNSIFNSRFSRSILLVTALSLIGCRLSQTPETPPLTLPQKVMWGGSAASRYSDSVSAGADSSAFANVLRLHFFEFIDADTLRLQLEEYREAAGAYSVFQQSASLDEMAEGWYRQGNALVFRHGKYLGRLSDSRNEPISGEALKRSLTFQGEELLSKPAEFSAFPLLGRIPNSDRVIPAHFLGCGWRGPVFTAGYRCHGDTATAFRAYVQNRDSARTWIRRWSGKTDTLNWGREIRFKGQDDFHRPLIFWLFSEGVMGFSGCSDSVLAEEYAQKLQKTAVLWPNP